jgi:hypothetical protein
VKKIELKWYGKASKRAIAIFLGYHEKVNNFAAYREIYIGPAATGSRSSSSRRSSRSSSSSSRSVSSVINARLKFTKQEDDNAKNYEDEGHGKAEHGAPRLQRSIEVKKRKRWERAWWYLVLRFIGL